MTLPGLHRSARIVRVPVSTYRLQLNAGFTFPQAAQLADYLQRLGVTDYYLSPSFRAAPGSPHGYDICDHRQLNPELGGDAGFAVLAASARQHDLGMILDFVPNHMGADPVANPWWRDVLENGPSSPYARFFDIDWRPIKPELLNKVLLPVLGDQYGRVLHRGELQVVFAEGAFALRYFEHHFPLNPRQMVPVLMKDVEALSPLLPPGSPELREFLSIVTALRNLPAYTETDPERIAERQREKEVARERLVRLAAGAPVIRRHIEHNVQWVNGVPGEPATFDPLHRILEAQAYRLAYWRTSMHEINYRRFFDINGLVGVRVEDPEVFRAVHEGILALVREGAVTGLRLDHIDGLLDPEGYLQSLDEALREARGESLYVVVEKILSAGEHLPPRLQMEGTTGYDFLNDVSGLFVDGEGALPLKRFHAQFTGRETPLGEVVYQSKSLIAASSLASELAVLANALDKLSETDRCARDFTLISLQEALREVSACFPIYRTYLGKQGISERGRAFLEQAIAQAAKRNPATEASIWDFVRDVLLVRRPEVDPTEDKEERRAFALKLQQYTGPLQAKGLEDTAFYRYNVLLSLNEVGGDPQRFGVSPRSFHAANQHRAAEWPLTMLATSTHDTKRGEDARCRIHGVSQVPDEWGELVTRWSKLNEAARTQVDGEPAPDRGDEYLFYQALLGAWPMELLGGDPTPAFVARMQQYMQKALRESKLHTSWVNNNEAYEQATRRFIDLVLDERTGRPFLDAFAPFCGRMAFLGMLNSLSQLTLKLASPGVPDFYQGGENWNLSLTDPDNRDPVDFPSLARQLAAMEPFLDGREPPAARQAFLGDLLRHWRDGRIKHFLTAAGLRLRRARRAVFLQGEYVPLTVEGARARNLVAFARRSPDQVAVVLAPRLCADLDAAPEAPPLGAPAWQDTRVLLPGELLAAPVLRDEFTSAPVTVTRDAGHWVVPVAAVLAHLPVALLVDPAP